MRLRAVLTAAVVAGLAGCASGPSARVAANASEPAVLAHVPYETNALGEKVVVVRDYLEPTKVAGVDDDRRVQYVWNYTRGTTQRRVWSADGSTFEAEDLPEMTLNATVPELDFAFETVRADPYFAKRITADTQLHGGFSVREPDTVCDTRARCVHVFGVRADGVESVLHAVVSLSQGKIVDYDIERALGGFGAKSLGESR